MRARIAAPILFAIGASAWTLFALAHLARAVATGTLQNALAGDLTQSAAAVLLAGGALWAITRDGRATSRGIAAWFVSVGVALVVTSVAFGQPWRGLAGAPLAAAVLLGAVVVAWLVPRRALGVAAIAGAWLIVSARLLYAGWLGSDVDVALVSYVVPGTIILAAFVALRPGAGHDARVASQPRS
jgi:hypothetical protein